MHVVWTHVPLQDRDVVRLADLSNQVTQPRPDFSSQDRLAVLWDEDEVVVTLVDRVRPVTVLLRTLHFIPKYRKPPEGFA
jgi:hypothetical protein